MHGSRTMARAARCVARWRRVRDGARDAGMSTAEYAVGTLAAVAFAGVLLKVVTSPGIQSALSAIISKALK
jgi:TRAP-type uncharacterized transport system fused permease subunit